jgi:hypothetical protein
MLRSQIAARGFRFVLWEAAAMPSQVSQDSSLVLDREFLRTAVIDGRTPAAEAPLVLGCDLAVHAAAMVRQALSGRGTPDEALAAANDFLYSEHDPARSAFPEATCVIADIDADSATLVQAGDCEAWARWEGRWSRLFPEGAMTGEAAERDRAWYRENADLEISDLLNRERKRDYVNDPRSWRTAAVGRFPTPKLDRTDVRDWDVLVLATDGARLRADRMERLDTWLRELRSWESANPRQEGILTAKPHDDVTVLWIERVPARDPWS